MIDQLTRPMQRNTRSRLSAHGLLMQYEEAVSTAVEATLNEGLRLSRATVAARQRAAEAWREPLTIVAAEELSRRLALQAGRGPRVAIRSAALRRALAPYAALVATAARTEMARQPHEFIAAD